MSTTLYRPSSGTEGDWFRGVFCDKCTKQRRCMIPVKTMWSDAHD